MMKEIEGEGVFTYKWERRRNRKTQSRPEQKLIDIGFLSLL